MQQKVVVVVPLSASKPPRQCWSCLNQHRDELFCPHCSKLQELPIAPPSPFEFFGVTPRLCFSDTEREALQATYYRLSKQLHPDKYAAGDPREAYLAERWTGALNRAYKVLRRFEDTCDYVLATTPPGFVQPSSAKPAPLMPLAHRYFEICEAIEDGGPAHLLETFSAEVQAQADLTHSEWIQFSQSFNFGQPENYVRLRQFREQAKYLGSLLADIKKKQGPTS